MKGFNEKDTIFSRMDLKEDTLEYKEYYKNHPDKKEIDDELRDSDGKFPQDDVNELARAIFQTVHSIGIATSEGSVIKKRNHTIEPELLSKRIKGLAKFSGAVQVGIAKTKKDYFYIDKNKSWNSYNANHEKYGIVFAVRMDPELLKCAPRFPEIIATAKGYLDAAIIGSVIKNYLNRLGFSAFNHMEGAYGCVPALFGQAAGLGEIGRSGLLVSPEYGPAIRLGVVTTNADLVIDNPVDYGIQKYCSTCDLCSKSCPGKAISDSDPIQIEDCKVWKIIPENCYRVWQKVGSDCGVCMRVCPYTWGKAGKNFETPYSKENPDWIK
ncbi:hypothetical protein KAJ27_01875 [bacterium]|nr:hypothetical protein [bacterium]